jgi:hypothetical protein
MWQELGRAMKRAGKLAGNQAMINKGREWQYGHLSPEQLMKQHPSAFLRTYAVQSKIEHPEHVGGRNASTHETYQLRSGGDTTAQFQGLSHITGGDGVRRPAANHFHLVLQDQAVGHQNLFESNQVGGNFHAALLPMRQATQDNFGNDLENARHHVANYKSGKLKDSALAAAHEDTTMTTQLSGCTIAKRRDNMLHIRPHDDGQAMQDSLPRASTFGRSDYGAGMDKEAFVMMKRKPDGRTRLYFQKHDKDTGEMTSGKMDFPQI